MPQKASPRPSTRSLPVSSAAAAYMTGPLKSRAMMVSGVSGPKLPKNTSRLLQPAFWASATAFTASGSFSTVVFTSQRSMPIFLQEATIAARRRSDNERMKQSRETAMMPSLTSGMFLNCMLFLLNPGRPQCQPTGLN